MKIRDETGAWADEQFGTLSLGDLPRDRRAKELLKRFAGWPTGSILGGAKAGSRRWRYIVLGAMNASTGDIAVASPETNPMTTAQATCCHRRCANRTQAHTHLTKNVTT
jgi:hypothetical protein